MQSKIGVRIIHGCALYTGKYGTYHRLGLIRVDLHSVFQSAYKPNHSTETALLKVKNDILMNMNYQHVTLLVLLDLSAAFDTVHHDILIARLKNDLGIEGDALSWLISYLSDRSQRISIKKMVELHANSP